MTVTAGRVVIGDDHIRTQQTNLEHHASQNFFLAPGAKCFFGRLRETKVTEAEKMRLGALHFSGGHGFAGADHSELFVEFGTNRILPAFTESREQRNSVHSVFAT